MKWPRQAVVMVVSPGRGRRGREKCSLGLSITSTHYCTAEHITPSNKYFGDYGVRLLPKIWF